MNIWMGRGTRRTARFLAGLVFGGGIDAAARAPNLVERTRNRAIDRLFKSAQLGAPPPAILPDLRHVTPEQVGDRTLVVLVRGLCSTDVGTFGDFEAHLRGKATVSSLVSRTTV